MILQVPLYPGFGIGIPVALLHRQKAEELQYFVLSLLALLVLKYKY